ncbi:MAG: energy transducer TonB [Ignavibacteriae bacterium HGW-Ignavibacteriae-2]|jgi:protein TonB|nr:energy transducer TonB [Bacteroidota bacterium]PKL87431.1 MAG: energy transducer TonB [Ignavibacteriae bacterium HGW-Ignavibacteriae-2]
MLGIRSFVCTFLLFFAFFGSSFGSAMLGGSDEEYAAFAEVMPEPVGGMGSIIKNIVYPEMARKSNVQGRVYILAYIDDQGNCTETKIVKGIGAGCDEAASDAIKKAKFTPGKNKGVAVKVKLSLPIEFKI